jgi:hypothetical protein
VKTPQPTRPKSVTILSAGVLIIAGLALLRLVAAIQTWAFLANLPGYSPLYIAISGGLWSIGGSLLFWGLWRGKGWAPRAARLGLPIYAGYYWFDRLVMSSEQVLTNAAFALAVTILGLLFCYWALSRPGSTLYFGDWHERTS